MTPVCPMQPDHGLPAVPRSYSLDVRRFHHVNLAVAAGSEPAWAESNPDGVLRCVDPAGNRWELRGTR
jgi:hypothetical protein